MAAHDGLDRLGRFVGVVEWDGGDVVVEDVGFDDAVHQGATDESKFAIDGCSGATSEVPGITGVVGQRWVGVLEESNSDCNGLLVVS